MRVGAVSVPVQHMHSDWTGHMNQHVILAVDTGTALLTVAVRLPSHFVGMHHDTLFIAHEPVDGVVLMHGRGPSILCRYL